MNIEKSDLISKYREIKMRSSLNCWKTLMKWASILSLTVRMRDTWRYHKQEAYNLGLPLVAFSYSNARPCLSSTSAYS